MQSSEIWTGKITKRLKVLITLIFAKNVSPALDRVCKSMIKIAIYRKIIGF
jgi:hypothetical protein